METDLFQPSFVPDLFATVILPIVVPYTYTYSIPHELVPNLQVGMRVEVQFGKNKLYTALVRHIHQEQPQAYKTKPILSVLDQAPVVTTAQMEFWEWIALYYCCTIGEVMSAALPASLKLSSETIIVLSDLYEQLQVPLSAKEYLIVEALTIQKELSLDLIQDILNQKTVYPIVQNLLEKKIIWIKEELQVKYKPKTATCVRLQEPYRSDTSLLQNAFQLIAQNATRQMETLLAFIQLEKSEPFVKMQAICEKANSNSSVVKNLVEKGIFELYEKNISRLGNQDATGEEVFELSPQQRTALEQIQDQWKQKTTVLLQGVTGSGKTQIYLELIQTCIAQGGQVLYLLPEIALTAQMIQRLQKVLGSHVAVFHSRLNSHERVEVWQSALSGKPVVLAARSGLFLPFKNLQLIIIDEEHDASFKQHEPNPRYQARDAAIYLAQKNNAKVLLGTATPAVETYHNAKSGKYGFVQLSERFGGLQLPEISIADLKPEMKTRKTQYQFSSQLIEALQNALANKEQAILFQNRRGYAPTYFCNVCDWFAKCVNCDVSITYHKQENQQLRCHYCGYQTHLPKACPACGNHQLSLKGFGTERIEDELKIYLPDARISRMDFDTVRSRHAHTRIINDFEEGNIDILVGTQMVTKGLDFDNVGVVGVISCDNLLHFPDFRANERALQLLMQVSGRAGRKHKRGKVILQAINTEHPVIKDVLASNFEAFYAREIAERQTFHYPPFTRLIRITLKHKDAKVLQEAGQQFYQKTKEKIGHRLLGIAAPNIPKVRNYYLLDALIKAERVPEMLLQIKQNLVQISHELQASKGFSQLRIAIDVDPN